MLGLRCCAQAFSSCGAQGLLIIVHGVLIAVGSLAVVPGLLKTGSIVVVHGLLIAVGSFVGEHGL